MSCSHSPARPFKSRHFATYQPTALRLACTVSRLLSAAVDTPLLNGPGKTALLSIARQCALTPALFSLTSELRAAAIELYIHSSRKLARDFVITAMLLDTMRLYQPPPHAHSSASLANGGPEVFCQDLLLDSLLLIPGEKTPWGTPRRPRQANDALAKLREWRDASQRVLATRRAFLDAACGVDVWLNPERCDCVSRLLLAF